MIGLKRLVLPVALLTLAAVSCEDSVNTPPPPPPPPPISLARVGENILKNDDVFNIFQDSKGRMWFSTERGVQMQDGSTTKWFDDFAGLPNRRCRAIAEHLGKIYIGTWGGGVAWADSAIIYTDTLLWNPLPVASNRTIGGRVSSLAPDPTTKSIYFGTTAGLSEYKDDPTIPFPNQMWAQHNSRLGPSKNVSAMTFNMSPTRGTELWVATRVAQNDETTIDGAITVIRFPGLGFVRFTPANSDIPGVDINDVKVDPRADLVWSAYSTVGVASVDVDAAVWKRITREDGTVSDVANSIAIQSDGTLWIGTVEGLTRIRPNGTVTNYVTGSGLYSRRVRTVYVDNDDNVWLGFVQAGAAKVLE